MWSSGFYSIFGLFNFLFFKMICTQLCFCVQAVMRLVVVIITSNNNTNDDDDDHDDKREHFVCGI